MRVQQESMSKCPDILEQRSSRYPDTLEKYFNFTKRLTVKSSPFSGNTHTFKLNFRFFLYIYTFFGGVGFTRKRYRFDFKTYQGYI